MKLAIKASAFITAAVLASTLVATAFAGPVEPITGYFGDVAATPNEVGKVQPPAVNVTAIVYDNTASAANFGVASTDLAAIWGDHCLMTGTGILNTHKLSLYNASAAGSVLTAQLGVEFYNFVTSAFLGGYTTNVNFGAGLNPGFFSTITVSGLDPLVINLNVSDIVILQHVIGFTGTANTLGIASKNPVTVGSSPTSMYIQASTVNGGVAGFYTFTNGPANPIYQVTVTVPTVGVAPSTWSKVKDLYRD